MKLLIATKNPGKFKEMHQYMGEPFDLISLADLGPAPDVSEDGATFEENAILKAKAYFEWSGIPTVAEDGGLEIDALGGQPGVFSRRWPTPEELASGVLREKSDEELIDLTLAKLAGVPAQRRTARIRAVGAYHDGVNTITETASIEGVIATERPTVWPHGLPFRGILVIPRFSKLYRDLTDEENDEVNQRRPVYTQLRDRILNKVSV